MCNMHSIANHLIKSYSPIEMKEKEKEKKETIDSLFKSIIYDKHSI